MQELKIDVQTQNVFKDDVMFIPTDRDATQNIQTDRSNESP